MGTRTNALWCVTSAGMELSWFFAWAMFSSVAMLHRPFPFIETIIAFVLAACITRISLGKGWRIVQIFGLQVLGFVVAALLITHRIYYASDALYSRGWLVLLFVTSRDVQEMLILLVNIFLIMILWTAGVTFAKRPRAYYAICGRFDFGLAAFFALFLARLIAVTKGGININESFSILFLFPFFLFSLLSIGMARIESPLPKTFLPGYKGVGIIVSFIAAVIVGAGSLVLFFLPGLTAAAQMSYRVLKVAGVPFGNLFVAMVRFMFMPRGSSPETGAESSKGWDWHLIQPGPQSWWGELLERILGWGLTGIVVLLLFAVAGVALFYVFRWLFSRTPVTNAGRPGTRRTAWWASLRALIFSMCGKIFRSLTGYRTAAEAYGALLGWAGRSGLSRAQAETPLEFGTRLHRRFPALKPQIEVIISAYNREAYRELALSNAQLATLRTAWRVLRSPLYWPSRVRSRLFSSPQEEEG